MRVERHDNRQQAWWQEQDAERLHFQPHTGKGNGVRLLQSLSQLTYFLQQGYHLNLSKQHHSLELSVQKSQWRTFLMETTTYTRLIP